MPEKKAPVIVVRKSRSALTAAGPAHPETPPARGPAVTVPAPVKKKKKKKASPGKIRRRAQRSRDSMALVARTFPALWPDFDKGTFRPMMVGIREQVKTFIAAHPDCGMTYEAWVTGIRVVISRMEYQRCVKAGETRYDIHGEPAGTVTDREAEYARLQLRRIRAKMAAVRPATPEGGGAS